MIGQEAYTIVAGEARIVKVELPGQVTAITHLQVRVTREVAPLMYVNLYRPGRDVDVVTDVGKDLKLCVSIMEITPIQDIPIDELNADGRFGRLLWWMRGSAVFENHLAIPPDPGPAGKRCNSLTRVGGLGH